MNWQSLLTAALSMLVIGIFHPIVLYAYRHRGWGIWPFFVILGLAAIISSLFTFGFLSITLALLGAACLWSVWELWKLRQKEQRR